MISSPLYRPIYTLCSLQSCPSYFLPLVQRCASSLALPTSLGPAERHVDPFFPLATAHPPASFTCRSHGFHAVSICRIPYRPASIHPSFHLHPARSLVTLPSAAPHPAWHASLPLPTSHSPSLAPPAPLVRALPRVTVSYLTHLRHSLYPRIGRQITMRHLPIHPAQNHFRAHGNHAS